ncbi:hypothetical protein BZG36_01418 [Bifiguratus adelaidae]|uniref:Replication factor C subunit 3 n=1 Tax=Bifiguratus adelaidae TaxID=1938954 RepID=A0A261Y4X6_9FUNG|nr:hypothetical protein BZG36_01418 [Bifiguratus adelaidae]
MDVTTMDVDEDAPMVRKDKGKAVESFGEEKPDNLPWVEKYRPVHLSDLVSHKDITSTIERFIDENRLPHLLLYGPPGTGKTSTILACARKLFGSNYKSMILELNASDDRGIDVVREQIKTFASTRKIFSSGFKLIILDEADAMTTAAQAALRRVIEKYTKNVRFCIICNYVSKIIPAIQSRCTRFRFSPLEVQQVEERLKVIVDAEKVNLTQDGKEALLKLSNGDMRRALNILQSCHAAYQVVDETAIYNCTGHPHPADVQRIVDWLMSEEFSSAYTSIARLKQEKGLALQDIITEFHNFLEAMEFPPPARIYLLDKLAELEYRLATGATEKIQLSALVGMVKESVDLAAGVARNMKINLTHSLMLGARVEVQGKRGTVRYVGTTSFQTGKWVGIELDEPAGKNSGVVQGKRYFECRANHGVFVRPSQVQMVEEATSGTSSPEPAISPSRRSVVDASKLRSPALRRSLVQPARSTAPESTRLRQVQQQEDTSSERSTTSSPVPLAPPTVAVPTLVQEQKELPPSQDEAPIANSKEVDDLRLKLRLLESKRQEDREKIREADKYKMEAEQLTLVRTKLQQKLSEMQAELRECKRELKEVNEEKDAVEIRYNDVLENLEMMTLDKEMAEERADSTQQEIEVLKEKVEELTVNLSVYQQEGDAIGHMATDGGEERSVEVVQLERQNERLKEALMRLRDVTSEQESELQKRIKSLEKDTSQFMEVQILYERTKQQLTEAEEQMEELRARLDDAERAEDIIEQLGAKNLALNDKLEELQIAIEDLEALKELNDELEENHVETEKQLQAEIDQKDALIRAQLEALRVQEETNADYETTILQFRELVSNLQSDLEQLRDKTETEVSERQKLNSQSQAMLSLNLQLQSTVMKAHAKAIDIDLRKLDVAQAHDELECIRSYLPDAFIETENDPVQSLLLLKRMAFKADLIVKYLDPSSSTAEDVVPTAKQVQAAQVKALAGQLGDRIRQLVDFIDTCPSREFVKLGSIYHDVSGTERRLDGLITLLREDELVESDEKASNNINDLQRLNAQLEHICDLYLSHVEKTGPVYVAAHARAVESDSEKMFAILAFIHHILHGVAKDEEISFHEGTAQAMQEVVDPLYTVLSKCKSLKALAKKLNRPVTDAVSKNMTTKVDMVSRLEQLTTATAKLGSFCSSTYQDILNVKRHQDEQKEPWPLSRLLSVIFRNTQQVLSVDENLAWTGADKIVSSLCFELEALNSLLADDAKWMPVTTGASHPWIERAKELKARAIINQDLDRKLQTQADEILVLIKDVKIKDQLLQESSVKIELLEKRMVQVKKQADQIAALEASLSEAKGEAEMYDKELSKLQQEYNQLQRQHVELQTEAARQQTSAPVTSAQEITHTTQPRAVPDQQVAVQLESLRLAIKYLREENVYLKSRDVLQEHARVLGSPHTASELPKDPKLQKCIEQSKEISRQLSLNLASPKLVVLPKEPLGRWKSQTKDPEYQYQKYQRTQKALVQRSRQLAEQIKTFQWNEQGPISSTQPLAKIRIPLPHSAPMPLLHKIPFSHGSELEKIHSIFLSRKFLGSMSTKAKDIKRIERLLGTHQDFPKKGIVFKDLFPVFQDPVAVESLIANFVHHIHATHDAKVDAVVGLDARGFLLGPLVALRLGAAFVPVRKQGKLPGECHSASYQKEYGEDIFEMEKGSIKPNAHVIVIDDLIATGGSAKAAGDLVHASGATVMEFLFVMELDFLKGRDKLQAPTYSLIHIED